MFSWILLSLLSGIIFAFALGIGTAIFSGMFGSGGGIIFKIKSWSAGVQNWFSDFREAASDKQEQTVPDRSDKKEEVDMPVAERGGKLYYKREE